MALAGSTRRQETRNPMEETSPAARLLARERNVRELTARAVADPVERDLVVDRRQACVRMEPVCLRVGDDQRVVGRGSDVGHRLGASTSRSSQPIQPLLSPAAHRPGKIDPLSSRAVSGPDPTKRE